MIILLSLIFILSAIFCWKWIYVPKRVTRLLENIPGPKRYSIFGSLSFIFSDDFRTILNSEQILNRLMSLSLEHGGIFKLWFANEPMVTITKAKYVEKLLSSQKHLDKADQYHILNPFIGNNCLLTLKEDAWRKRHKVISPAYLHSEFATSMMMSVNKKLNTLLKILNEKFQTSNQQTLEINLQPFISKCGLDITLEAGIGDDLNVQTDSSHKDTNIYGIFKGGSNLAVFDRVFIPWLRPNFLWNLLSEGRKEQEYVRIAKKFTKEKIETKIKRKFENTGNVNSSVKGQNEIKNGSFFDRLLTISEKGKTLDFNILFEEMKLFIIASHDTTSCDFLIYFLQFVKSACLYFTIYLLAHNPEAQKLVHEELVEIFGIGKNPNFEKIHLSRMKYMEMVIKESLRLFPTVPFIGRKLSSDLDLGNGMILPAGICVFIFSYILHRDPEIFDNPEEFRPERWSPENCEGRSKYAYTPFSIGPRNCLGQKHAMMALKIGIGKILLDFSIECDIKQDDLSITPNIVLQSKNPIFCKLTKRH